MKKRVKKDNLVSREELLALLERLEAESLKEGDAQILKAVIEKTFTLRQLVLGGQDALPGQAEATAGDPTTGEMKLDD